MFSKRTMIKRDVVIAVAAGLIVSLVSWSTMLRFISTAHAVSLTSVSDTLSDSRPGFAANHTIAFTDSTSTVSGQTITYTFDPTTSAFGNVGGVVIADVTSTGMTIAGYTCSNGGTNVSLATTTNSLVFTVCGGATIPAGTVTLKVLNNTITNPTSTGSYVINVAAGANSAATRVAIVNGVNVTAAVATTFTFTVAGLATSTTLGNGATTTGASTSTTVPFGIISPNTHAELGQQLYVTTNAANGFAVTVHEDQDLTSQTGNTIHLFDNGNATSTPSPWAAPSNIINQPATYGHLGVTSDDASSSLVGAPSFGTSTPLYAGSINPTSTLTVFAWNGPADGTTQNVGTAKVAYRIEIGTLQPAANDYTNNLIYVATPTF